MKYWVIDKCLTNRLAVSRIGTMTIKSCEAPRSVHYEQSKLKIVLNTNKKEFLNAMGAPWCQASDCHMSTLVLGIYGVGTQRCQASDCCESTLVLGIWCGKNKTQENLDIWKTGHCLMSLRRKILMTGQGESNLIKYT